MKFWPFKRQTHKMVKRTQLICRFLQTNCLNVFDYFVGLAFKGLSIEFSLNLLQEYQKAIWEFRVEAATTSSGNSHLALTSAKVFLVGPSRSSSLLNYTTLYILYLHLL